MMLSAGGSPAATHFLCLAKESKQRKATASRCSFGVPSAAPQKMGSERNSLRSNNVHFSIHFLQRITGSVTADYFPRLACGIGRGIVKHDFVFSKLMYSQ
jgi:hypothetical protein